VAKHNGRHFSFYFYFFFYFLFGSRHRTGEHLSFLGLFWAAAEQMPNRPAIAQAANLLLPRLFSLFFHLHRVIRRVLFFSLP
jgi:hypothetical protein